jgi:cyclic pyranopterin phosphate synthase
MAEFTHLDEEGRVRMVDVTEKAATARTATAGAEVRMRPDTFELIRDRKVKKGNVLETARIAGIMAAKRTPELIPMCHPLNVTHVEVDFLPDAGEHAIGIRARVKALDQTGVEMEALTAAAVAALTIYDMCKSHDREMTISRIRLLEKTGGKSGALKLETET